MKIFILILSMSVFSNPVFANQDCAKNGMHQKDQAICLVKTLVSNYKNIEINQFTAYAELQGLEKSGEFNALFLGGKKGKLVMNWNYLVGVDYYGPEKFISLAVVVRTFPNQAPEVVEVLSQSRMEELIK